MMKELFPAHTENEPVRTAILLSGTGSNARALLEQYRKTPGAWRPVLLVTDNPASSAPQLAEEFGLPLLTNDIRRFYADAGEDSIKLDSPRRRELRTAWSNEIAGSLAEKKIGLVLFAGFIPMTNLTEVFPCLNVHPGDLTVTDPDGSRPFAGLHYKPVEEALCRGWDHTRSSVILAQPYSGSGEKEMDSGPVIGVSEKIFFELSPGMTEKFRSIRSQRQQMPPRDELRSFAAEHIEKMKIHGDHEIFFRAADDFARGKFLCGEKGELFYRTAAGPLPILSAEYTVNSTQLIERQN